MKRTLIVVALVIGVAAVSATAALASSNPASASGGGKVGDLKFQISAHTDTPGVVGAASGHVGLRSSRSTSGSTWSASTSM